MLETLVASYISTLNVDVVLDYAKKQQNYELSIEEAEAITSFLKTYWRNLLHKETDCFSLLKSSLRGETYHRVIQLYEENKNLYLK